MRTLRRLAALFLASMALASPVEASDGREPPQLQEGAVTAYEGVEVARPTHPEGTPAYDGQLRANLLQAVIAANPFDAPEPWVSANHDLLLEDVAAQNGGELPPLSPADKLRLRLRAEFAAKSGMLLRAVARKESIVVTEADLEARFARIAAEQQQPVSAIKVAFAKDVDALRSVLLEEKALDWLLERAVLQKGP